MTTRIFSICIILMAYPLNAQQPSLAGDWHLEQQRIRSHRGESGEEFLRGYSEGLDLEIFPDHRFSAGTDSGRWIFSNGYLLAIQKTHIDSLALNEGGDSFTFATSNSFGSPSESIRESGFTVALKRPSEDPTSVQVAGDWVLLRQSLQFSEIDEDGSVTANLLEVNHNRTDINLDVSGTFQGEVVTDTESPENQGTMLSGTWLMNDGEFSALVGGETVSRPNLSAGGDLIIHGQEDSLENGNETLLGTTTEIWLKRPDSLAISDVVGSWGLAGSMIEVLPDTGSNTLELVDIGIQNARIAFNLDGTGTISNLNSETVLRSDPAQNVTWTIDSKEIVVTAGGRIFRFTMSAGKDFAGLLKSELDPDSNVRRFDFFALSKLPKTPGFAADAANGSLSGPSGINPVVALTIQSVEGIPYQVQESANLADWITRSAPIVGTGEKITSTFEAISAGTRFYRWKLLPLGEPP